MSLWDSADVGWVWLVLPGSCIGLCGRCWEGQESGWGGSANASYASCGIIRAAQLWSTVTCHPEGGWPGYVLTATGKSTSEQKYVSTFLKPLFASCLLSFQWPKQGIRYAQIWEVGRKRLCLPSKKNYKVTWYMCIKEGIKNRAIKAINLSFITMQGKMSKPSWLCVYCFWNKFPPCFCYELWQ